MRGREGRKKKGRHERESLWKRERERKGIERETDEEKREGEWKEGKGEGRVRKEERRGGKFFKDNSQND